MYAPPEPEVRQLRRKSRVISGMDEHTLELISWGMMALATFVIVASVYLILRNRL